MRTFVAAAFATILAGCTPAEVAVIDSKVPPDVLADVDCLSTELLQGALTDPLAILAECGSLVLSQLVSLAEAELVTVLSSESAPSAGGQRHGHHARVTLTDAQRTRVIVIRDAAIKLESAATDGGK